MNADRLAPNYTAKTVKQRRAILETRGISHKDVKLKADLVTAVEENDILQRKWVDPRWTMFFQRDFKADLTRKSLLDLPAEVRVMIFRWVFDVPEITTKILQIEYAPYMDHFRIRNAPRHEPNDVLDTMITLQSLNKVIRHESRPTFWSLASFPVAPRFKLAKTDDSLLGPSYMAAFDVFLRNLGDQGRYGVKSLTVVDSSGCCTYGARPLGFSIAGYASFTSACNMLSACASLTALRFTASELYLFRDDEDALKGFFNRGDVLKSKGLDRLRQILQALPKLRVVNIDIPRDIQRQSSVDWSELTPFLRYAFTRRPRQRLWVMVKAILESAKLQTETSRVHVHYNVAWIFWMRFKGNSDVPNIWEVEGSVEEIIFSKCQSTIGEYDNWFARTSL